MNLRYFSHSAFMLTTNDGINILIDPFLDGNPTSPVRSDEVRADYIIVTHGHGDHLGDTVKIAKRCGAVVIATFELANFCESQGCTVHAMHIGGSHKFPFGKVKFTPALHGSSSGEGITLGTAAGVLLLIEGKVIYHTGDTGLFYDMKLIGEINAVDYMLLPIGDNFTMGIDDAVKAVEFVNPNCAIPIHYNTFPVINADPIEFIQKINKLGKEGKVLTFGETISI